MSLGVRGANPIWSLIDLDGNLFDDNFYMYVLQNTLPYQPSPVYHDPDLNIPWANPIQFLGNGTLPRDIFFVSGEAYRLEFRQNNGIDPPSQSDPLIYEVNNYVAGTSGSAPVDTVALSTVNQITNPQFALLNFTSTFSLTSATDPLPIKLGAGWYLELAGTGNVTVERVALNDSNANPSNAPYALRLQLSGWNADGVKLRQRFNQNGMLWANKIVSSAVTTRVQGSPVGIRGILIDSNNTTLAEVLNVLAIGNAWNEFTGHGTLPATSNPDLPPVAYVDYRLELPNNADIYLTSLQLLVQELPIEPRYEQDSIERQIDYTYHSAHPIVPVGSVIAYHGFGVPEHYLVQHGQTLNRNTYNLLFEALTHVETVSLTTSTSTFTVTDSSELRIGMPVEGNGIPASTTITNISTNTITISNNATLTGQSDVRFFSCGAGDGSTTFTLNDTRNCVIADMGGNMFGGGANNGIGAKGGSLTHTQTIAEMPAHNHPGSTVNIAIHSSAPPPGTVAGVEAAPTAVAVATEGNGQPFPIIQPTILMKLCIRFE